MNGYLIDIIYFKIMNNHKWLYKRGMNDCLKQYNKIIYRIKSEEFNFGSDWTFFSSLRHASFMFKVLLYASTLYNK